MPARSTTHENNNLLQARFFAIEVERSNAVKEQIADAMVAVGLESQDLSKPANIPPGQWRSQNAARTRAVADHESSHAILGASMGLEIAFVTVALDGRSGLCSYVGRPTAPQMLRLSLAGLVANDGRGQGIFGVYGEGGDIQKAQMALLELTGRDVSPDDVLSDPYIDDFRSEVANFMDEHNSAIAEVAAELVANLGLRVDGSVVHKIWNRRAEKVRQMQTA